MNRKERRAAHKRRGEGARTPNALTWGSVSTSVADLFAEANRCHGWGWIGESQEICRQILAREPTHVQSLNLLGVTAQASGDHRGALKMFTRALASDELNAACHYNIGNSYQALGSPTEAIAHFKKALALGMSEQAAAEFILQSPIIASCVAGAANSWPPQAKKDELFDLDGIAPLAEDLFLRCAMESTTLQSLELEGLLGYARAKLLQLVDEQSAGASQIDDHLVAFACALAQQCFINEYV